MTFTSCWSMFADCALYIIVTVPGNKDPFFSTVNIVVVVVQYGRSSKRLLLVEVARL